MHTSVAMNERLSVRPATAPLDWHRLATAFDAFVMNPANRVRYTTSDGQPAFSAFLESSRYGTASHELVTYGPLVLGKLLRGDDVSTLAHGLNAYFDQARGVFLNSPGVTRIELWYLMYANTLAAHLIRRLAGQAPELTTRWRRSAETLRQMAQRIDYDFNHQGYDFAEQKPWTARDIYRQPDSIGGYAYLMVLAYEMCGDDVFLQESRTALGRYLSFAANPWYEAPNGALALVAAARLCPLDDDIDPARALALLLDPAAALVVGAWGGHEVNGLMRGWRYSAPESAYSMESLMVVPHILPAARYDVRLAEDIGRYALHIAANARCFFSEFMRGQESRPDLSPAVPYERLLAEYNGYAPYAMGDFEGHKSIYGGAYVLWWDALVRPTEDPLILRLDLTRSDFLVERAYPTFLYYNPWDEERFVAVAVGEAAHDVYELTRHTWLARNVRGKTMLAAPPMAAQVIVLCPAGAPHAVREHTLFVNDVAVDFMFRP
jgi:hypothetical protein